MQCVMSAVGLYCKVGGFFQGEGDHTVFHSGGNAQRAGTDDDFLERFFRFDGEGNRLVHSKGQEIDQLGLLLLPLMTGPPAVKGHGGHPGGVQGNGLTVHSNGIVVADLFYRLYRINM